VPFGLAGVVQPPYRHSVVQDAEGERRDEGEAEPGRDEALGGPVVVGFYHPAGREPGWPKAALVAAQPRAAGLAYLGLAGSAALTDR
jgi:hypothetical protein